MNTTKGWKTSEFWVTALTLLGTLVNQSGAFHFTLPIEQIEQLVTAASTYVASRSVLKAVMAYAEAKISAANVQPADNSKVNK